MSTGTAALLAQALVEDRRRFVDLRPVSRETLRDLDLYVAALTRWQASINLVGPATLPQLWTRHFLDSVQLMDHAPAHALRWVDLGSGAGFPGLVIALALKGRAGATVTLVESNGKKAGFLRAVAREISAPADVRHGRIEDVVPRLASTDVVTARALAPLTQLFAWVQPLLKSGAIALFPKGRDLDKERADAARYWDFSGEVLPSVVTEESHILRIHRLTRRSGQSIP
ncbi:MAG TPA: 16S rRNA (guanine(527)-N(7))-methyltransferase RsmG [Beijerinckiaceae bacterium]|nr:16S rRNA (guanine(527)-N(7))-methyltransferase RsmG [Beijerinckiaceae bacterium]